jgi:hypothetical protein
VARKVHTESTNGDNGDKSYEMDFEIDGRDRGVRRDRLDNREFRGGVGVLPPRCHWAHVGL